jgi:cytochrome c oxidase subunit 3
MSELVSGAQDGWDGAHSERTRKMVLYLGIFSIIMLFAGFSSAYVVTSYSELWVNMALPGAFYISTLLILLSSATIHLSVKASNSGAHEASKKWLIATLILGFGFGVTQYMGWGQMVQVGGFLSGHVDSLDGVYGEDYTITYKGQELVYEEGDYYFPGDDLREKPLLNEISIFNNSSSSYIYVLSFMHLLHVLGGWLFFVGILLVAVFRKRPALNNLRLRLGATYWHFVDILWIYLLLFLLLIH